MAVLARIDDIGDCLFTFREPLVLLIKVILVFYTLGRLRKHNQRWVLLVHNKERPWRMVSESPCL